MSSCPTADSLVRFLTSHSNESERTRIIAHIEDCISCQDRLYELVLAAPGPAPSQITLALSEVRRPSATAEAEEFIEALKRNVLIGGSVNKTVSTPPFGGFDARPQVAGYEILEELGRGASGVVYRARHCELDRLVALKMIFTGPHLSAEVRRRLRVEGQAIARLEHPNIVRVYDVNERAECPYLSLELVEGENLSHWKGGGARPAVESAGLVATMANAIAYAHSKGVIHRDLKPANVLLGIKSDAAPACSLGGDAAASISMDYELKITDFGVARVLPRPGIAEARMTQSGMILGTPAYVAPEQAQGKTNEIGLAADIYSMGAILYELLTGRPPFLGETAMEVLVRAAHEVPVAPTRLIQGLTRELDTICLKCLEKDPTKRYTTANELAEDLTRFLRREPILARPACRTRTGMRWVRRHPAMTVLLAGNLFLVTALACGGLTLFGDQAAMRRGVENELQEVDRLRAASAWREATAHLDKADVWLGNRGPAQLRQRLAQARNDLEQGERNEGLAARLDAIRLSRATIVAMGKGHGVATAESRFRNARADRRYAEAFRDAGLGNLRDLERDAVERIAKSSARGKILTGLDDWVSCAADENRRNQLLSIARLADDDPSRNRLRDPSTWNDARALDELGRTARLADLPVSLLSAVGERLLATGSDATSFFQRVREAHPDAFWANFALGNVLNQTRHDDAVDCYRKALSFRPRTAAVYNNLGCCAYNAGRWREAIGHFKKALELDNAFAPAFSNLGLALKGLGPWDQARDKFAQALQIDPELAPAHYNLAEIDAFSGRMIEAIDHYQQAIRLDRDFAWAHYKLGVALLSRDEVAQAEDRHERSLRADPRNKRAHDMLHGFAYDAAHSRYKQALAFDRRWCPGHFELGTVMRDDLLSDGIDLYRQAIRLDPEVGQAYGALGQALLAQGKFDQALTATRRSLDVLPPGDVSRTNLTSQLQRCERLLVLEQRLPGVLSGTNKPADNAERLEFADLCGITKRYVSSARLYVEMLAVQPRIAENSVSHDRYAAARAAILAGCGRGDESAALDQDQRVIWLEQARDWLRAELAAWTKKLESGSTRERAEVRGALARLQIEPEIDWLRSHDTSTNVSSAERQKLSTYWSELAELFRRSLDIRK